MYTTPKTLENALLDGFVVPFVGAGVSRAVCNTTGQPLFPGWSELLSLAAARLRDDGKHPEANVVEGLVNKRNPDYLAAAQHAREGLGPVWYQLLKDTFAPARDCANSDSLALARAIWKLPSRLVVTTNYDEVLRWSHEKPDDVVPLKIDPGAELAAVLRDNLERPTVWHIHGHIHDAANLILTPDGYRTLYPEREGAEVRFASGLQSLRHLLAARTCLFIGFSMEDERFGDQIEWVNQAFFGAAGPHYLLVRERELRETQRRLARLDNVECLPFADFGKPLLERIESLAATRRSTARAEAPLADTTESKRAASFPAASLPKPSGRVYALADVRASYRRIHEHQRQLFDRLTELSDEFQRLGMDFERWDPLHYSRPARSSSEFFRRPYWAWDFLPAFALELSWQSPAGRGSVAKRVVVNVENDDGYPAELAREPQLDDFVEPVEAVRSELWIGMFRSTDPSGPWSQAWQQLSKLVPDPLYDGSDHTVRVDAGHCTYRALGLDLGEVMDKASLANKVIEPIRSWYRQM